MKMDFTAKDLQRRIEEVKNDNDPDPILYEKIKSYDNSEARRHINLPSVLSETKKTNHSKQSITLKQKKELA